MEPIERLVVDTNAVVDFLRDSRQPPPAILLAWEIFLPLHVLGELYGGARLSGRVQANLSAVDGLLSNWRILYPNLGTAQIYGRLRTIERHPTLSASRTNDLWIAALCLQHNLPLVTNDRGFDSIDGLTVIHW